MGYNTYKEYVAGVVWADIRDRVFRDKGDKCIVCSRRATVIHHKVYSEKVLRGTDIMSLEPLCWDCHNRIEYGKNGEKLSLDHANAKLQCYINNRHVWDNGWSGVATGVKKERKYTTYSLTK